MSRHYKMLGVVFAAALLGACSGDITGVERRPERTTATQPQIRDEGVGPGPVNKCAIYRTKDFCELQ